MTTGNEVKDVWLSVLGAVGGPQDRFHALLSATPPAQLPESAVLVNGCCPPAAVRDAGDSFVPELQAEAQGSLIPELHAEPQPHHRSALGYAQHWALCVFGARTESGVDGEVRLIRKVQGEDPAELPRPGCYYSFDRIDNERKLLQSNEISMDADRNAHDVSNSKNSFSVHTTPRTAPGPSSGKTVQSYSPARQRTAKTVPSDGVRGSLMTPRSNGRTSSATSVWHLDKEILPSEEIPSGAKGEKSDAGAALSGCLQNMGGSDAA